jgi:hypothetical protein
MKPNLLTALKSFRAEPICPSSKRPMPYPGIRDSGEMAVAPTIERPTSFLAMVSTNRISRSVTSPFSPA